MVIILGASLASHYYEPLKEIFEDKKIIQIDIDSENTGYRENLYFKIIADLKAYLPSLIKHITKNQNITNLKHVDNFGKNFSEIYICNPHNPTSSEIMLPELINLIEICNEINIKVIIDEAYMEYSSIKNSNSCGSLINKYNNLIIIKTLSKIYPLAGVRCDFVLVSQEVIEELKFANFKDDDIRIIDGMPIPVCKFGRAYFSPFSSKVIKFNPS